MAPKCRKTSSKPVKGDASADEDINVVWSQAEGTDVALFATENLPFQVDHAGELYDLELILNREDVK